MANSSDNNFGFDSTFVSILKIAVFLFFLYMALMSPSSKEQADHDFYQENGMTRARYDYLQSEDTDEVYSRE